jgi:hypothetical protein
MLESFREKVGSLSRRKVLLWGLAAAAVIEIATVIMRFGFAMQATRDTAWLAPYTFGYREHHGYYIVPLVIISLLVKNRFWKNALVIIGIGCFVSDLAHHFIVLWPITGHHEFHIRYPGY